MVMSTARPVIPEGPVLIQVHLVRDAGVARLEVSGDVDLCSDATLQGALADALAGGTSSIVVALDRCEFFAACGYRSLAEAADVALSRGGSLIVEGAPTSLRIIAGVVDEPGIVFRGRDGHPVPVT